MVTLLWCARARDAAGAREAMRRLLRALAVATWALGRYRVGVDSVPIAAVIVASDRCAAGEATDRSGPRAAELLAAAGFQVAGVEVVPDGLGPVRAALDRALAGPARVVVTSGGTGVGPHDQTPEATAGVIARELPGLAEAIRREGARHTPTAALSRGLAGVTAGGVLVVNTPGSPAAVEQSLAVVLPVVRHVLDQVSGGDH